MTQRAHTSRASTVPLRFTGILLAMSLSFFVLPVTQAQVQRSGGGEAQKFMQQYQQLAAEKTALQTQLAQAKKDLDDARAELATTKKERDASKTRAAVPTVAPAALTQANAARATAEHTLEQYKQRMNELVGRFRDTASNLKEVEADRAQLRKDLTERDAKYDRCAAANLELYDINKQVLDRYEHVGMFTRVSASEPFTRLSRTRIENLVDETRARALELRVKKPAP